MENVTSVGFTSCALRHNAKLPDLELAGGPAATGPAQRAFERPPSRGDRRLIFTPLRIQVMMPTDSLLHLYMPTLAVPVCVTIGDDDIAWLVLLEDVRMQPSTGHAI